MDKIKILLVGCGGREYSIAKCMKKNKNVNLLVIGSYKNPKLIDLADEYIINNIDNPMNYINIIGEMDYVIIGPEKPLEAGVANLFQLFNIPTIGPICSYARIETDKNFCRELMRKNDLNNYSPKYRYFDTYDYKNINETIDLFKNNYVIKDCGLCSGKGVKISDEQLKSREDAIKFCDEILNSKSSFLIEEKLIGEEFSLMCFTDGVTCRHMPVVKDYKRLYDNDEGPNTGSMGSISFKNHSLPFLSEKDLNEAKSINEKILQAMNKENNYYELNKLNTKTKYLDNHLVNNVKNTNSLNNKIDLLDLELIFNYNKNNINHIGYRGILYGSFIKTKNGIKVIEYNCRFGDPECINCLEILETDLNEIFEAINTQTLHKLDIKFKNLSTICKYIVPDDYPQKSSLTNRKVYISDKIDNNNIIYASVESDESTNLLLKGSRAIALIHSGKSMSELIKEINENSKLINGPIHYRTDIGNLNITYTSCGVDIQEGNNAVSKIKSNITNTYNNNVINNFGDFAGLYSINKLIPENGDELILVSSIDGVGTKLNLLPKLIGKKAYEILGQDIVNHSINDILVKNAKPLLFMDYIASSEIDSDIINSIVKGMSDSCKQHNCPILGGETAEMPGIYKNNEYDIVGSIIGYVEKNKIIDGKKNIENGTKIIAIPSDSPHTNGYSLIRKLYEYYEISEDILKWLCIPHKSYFNEIEELNKNNIKIQGLCHITGGGLLENPPRVLNENLKIEFKIHMDEKFKKLQNIANISNEEMYKTFNCGLGMLVFVSENDCEKTLDILKNFNNDCYICGEVFEKQVNEKQVYIQEL